MRVSIVDYGVGNLLSVVNGVETCGFEAALASTPEAILEAERLILPGVGAFSKAMDSLRARGFIEPLHTAVLKKRVPILGICLGMQLMAKRSYELGGAEGLGWFDAEVVRLNPDSKMKVPQIGWNSVRFSPDSPLFQGLGTDPVFYFVHSFQMHFAQPTVQLDATCDYGQQVTAAVRRDSIFATQFHPEKSSENGLRVLENFLRWQQC